MSDKVRVTCAECGAQLWRYSSALRRTERSFCPGGQCQTRWRNRELGNPASRPEVGAKISAARLAATADVRAALVDGAPPCGSPGCTDSVCEVPEGRCHFPGCAESATTAPKTAAKRREVRGRRRKFCKAHALSGGGSGGGKRKKEAAEALASRLLAEAGRCGSPTCVDPACTVSPGKCHLPGCDQKAAVARRTNTASRWVRGKSTLCCCGAHGGQYARLLELQSLGLKSGSDVAGRLRLSPSRVVAIRKAGHLAVADADSWRALYTEEDVMRFERDWALNLDDGRRARWLDPDKVVSDWRRRGWLARFAARRGLTESEAEVLVRAKVQARAKRLRSRRRGRAKGRAERTLRRALAFWWTKVQYEQWSPEPVSDREVARYVAQLDYEHHPRDWAYNPCDHPQQAAQVVLEAAKVLQCPVREILAA